MEKIFLRISFIAQWEIHTASAHFTSEPPRFFLQLYMVHVDDCFEIKAMNITEK